MSVYRPKNSPFYHYDFQSGGRRFCGSTGKTSRREAEALERDEKEKAKASLKAGKAGGHAPLTLDLAVARYWQEVGQHHANAETTWTDLLRLVDYFGQAKRLADITDADVARLVRWRAAQPAWGRAETKNGQPMKRVSAATVNRSTTLVLKKLFTRAKRTWRHSFPLEPVWNDHFLNEPKERVRELKKEEGAAISLATRADYAPILGFARATGLRLEECILRWSEVDFETGWITRKGKGDRLVKTAITSTVRQILEPLTGDHPEFVFTYRAARTRKPKTKGDASARIKGTRYPITYSGLKTAWKAIRKTAGVQDFRFHDFRHDVATKLLRATGNLKMVQKALNHADLKTTSRYAHVLDEEVASAMEALHQAQNRDTKSRKKSRTGNGDAS